MGTNLSELSRKPFLDRDTTFVPLPGHAEAVARLVYTIEARDRLAVLSGTHGVGKSRVLAQALHEARAPARRVSPYGNWKFDGPRHACSHSSAEQSRLPDALHAAAAWLPLMYAWGTTPGRETARIRASCPSTMR